MHPLFKILGPGVKPFATAQGPIYYLAQLQQEYPTLAGIVAQLEKVDMVDGYKGDMLSPQENRWHEVRGSNSGDTDAFCLFSWVAGGRASGGSLRPQAKYIRIWFGKGWTKTYVPRFVHVKLVLLVNRHRTTIGGILNLCFRASPYKSNETPTWCNTVQVLFLQSRYMFRAQAPINRSI